jgi:iron only hydrogenase large subunit-like protein
MLITLQSHNEVIEFIANQNASPPTETRRPVLSISPQSLASLSASISANFGEPPLSLLVLLRRIRSFLARPEHGGWRVWDTTFSRHLSLLETRVEYQQRASKKGKEKAALPVLASACPGWVCYAEKAQGDLLPLMSTVRSSQGIMGALVKNWWAGQMGLSPNGVYHVTAMPCYDKKLEASRSDFYNSVHQTRDTDCVLTTGELDLLLQDLGFDPLAPCSAEQSTPPTDLSEPLSAPWPELLNHAGSSSGSYLSTIITHMSLNHHNPTRVITREIRGSSDNVEFLLEDTVTGEVIFKGSKCYGFRNLQNLVRKVGKETGIGKGARGAGKLSAAVAARRRKAKVGSEAQTPATATPTTDGESTTSGLDIGLAVGRDEKKLDFVEVMACPSGCVNGGGQMKPVTSKKRKDVEVDEEGYERPIPDEGVEVKVEEEMRWSTKDWVAKVEEIYWSGLPTPPSSPRAVADVDAQGDVAMQGKESRLGMADQLAEKIVREACGDDETKRANFLRATFAKVEGDVLGGAGGITHEAVKW